ncbi:MAG: DUF4097 family beta strand repeat-containing protein [Prevotellaceae bacterium]|jgi:DUF4097 and DUF4098 domain-containing protein YvlB|nr:DUF4097 family beta strand repeat-containing protein [Prevotellaceae bacterium]
MTSNPKLVFFVLLGIPALLFALLSADFNTRLVNTQEIDLEGITQLEISYVSGDVTVYKSESNQLVLKEYMRKNNSDLYAVVSKSGNSVSIENGERPKLRFGSYNVRVEVFLPASFHENLTVSTGSGNIVSNADLNLKNCRLTSVGGSVTAKRIDGNTFAESISGSIRIGELKGDKFSLETRSGSIALGDVDGKMLDVETVAGKIEIHKLKCPSVDVTSISGSIRIGELNGDKFSLETRSGSVALNDVDGKMLDVETVAGKIEIGKLKCPSVDATSVSGSIRIGELKGTKFNLETRSGSVALNGVDGENLDIETTSGKIEIDRLKSRFALNSISGAVKVNEITGFGNVYSGSGYIHTRFAALSGNVSMHSISGSVSMQLPSETGFDLKASSSSGMVNVNYGAQQIAAKSVAQRFGEPNHTVDLQSTSGSIRVNDWK